MLGRRFRALAVRLALLVAVISALLLPAAARADEVAPPPAVEGPAADEGHGVNAADEGPGVSAADEGHGVNAADGVAHVPTVGRSVERPGIPPSYNTLRVGDWLTFSYPPEIRQQVEPLVEQAPSVRQALAARLGQRVLGDVHVRIARTPGEMAELAPAGAPFPRYASGVAYSSLGLVLLTVTPPSPNALHDLPVTFRHELAHVALHDALGGARVPRWFNEGFAVFASGEGSVERLQSLWLATLSEDFQSLGELERTFPADATEASVAYAQAADVVRFLVRRQDADRFRSMISRMRPTSADTGQSFESSLRDSYGVDLASLELEWREDVGRRYTFWPVLFSGGLLWIGMIGLFVVAWRRRARRNRETLDRWSAEEAKEDDLRRRAVQAPRVHIVLARPGSLPPEALRPSAPPGEVPKIEHDGNWHTVH